MVLEGRGVKRSRRSDGSFSVNGLVERGSRWGSKKEKLEGVDGCVEKREREKKTYSLRLLFVPPPLSRSLDPLGESLSSVPTHSRTIWNVKDTIVDDIGYSIKYK